MLQNLQHLSLHEILLKSREQWGHGRVAFGPTLVDFGQEHLFIYLFMFILTWGYIFLN